jgi:hypothetical protein
MSDTTMALLNPNLSPSFQRARTLSRFLVRLFTLFFWLIIIYLAVAFLLLALAPPGITLDWQDAMLPLGGHAPGDRLMGAIWLAVGVVPGLFLLHHARKLFGCFSRGEVFAVASVSHIRAAGFWLVVSALATLAAKMGLYTASCVQANVELDVQGLVFGVATFIAAYVMAEARRIADDNASIL